MEETSMGSFEDDMKIPRVIGIFISWAVWTVSTMNLASVTHSAASFGKQLAVSAGFILGNLCYARLWIAEGRARERAERARRSRDVSAGGS